VLKDTIEVLRMLQPAHGKHTGRLRNHRKSWPAGLESEKKSRNHEWGTLYSGVRMAVPWEIIDQAGGYIPPLAILRAENALAPHYWCVYEVHKRECTNSAGEEVSYGDSI
jgi:hypothetical protein